MQIGSLVWGFLTFLVMLAGFMPLLKVFQWVNLPFAAFGLVLGILALLRGGANRGPAIVGFACCALAAAVAVVRLTLGPGIV